MSSEIRLIAIDIDGTLLNSKNELTDGVIKAINQAKQQGIKVVIATGRPLHGALNLLDQLGLNDQDDQYILCFGGAVVQTTSGHILSMKTLSYDDYLELELIGRKLQLHFHASSPDAVYTANRDIGKYTVHEATLVDLPIRYRTPDEMRQVKIVKAMFVDEPAYLDQQIADHGVFAHLDDRLNFTKTAAFYYEANAKGVDKGAGLKILCAELGLTKENVMAIGDQENDLAMIKFAKIGVAMGNATAEVKQAAQLVVADNDHDGVKEAIERVL